MAARTCLSLFYQPGASLNLYVTSCGMKWYVYIGRMPSQSALSGLSVTRSIRLTIYDSTTQPCKKIITSSEVAKFDHQPAPFFDILKDDHMITMMALPVLSLLPLDKMHTRLAENFPRKWPPLKRNLSPGTQLDAFLNPRRVYCSNRLCFRVRKSRKSTSSERICDHKWTELRVGWQTLCFRRGKLLCENLTSFTVFLFIL